MTTTPSGAAAPARVLYRERLTPPWWGWLLAAFWASTLGIAYGYAITTTVGLLVGVGLFVVAAIAMVQMSAVIAVSDSRLVAGRATVPAFAIGGVTALDADAARRKRGTEADPRAFVLLRGWVSGAVVVTLDDRTDPTPYWFISTRRPESLALALDAATGRTGSGVPADASGSGDDDVTGSTH